MPAHTFRCPNKVKNSSYVQCKWCDSSGVFNTVLNYSQMGSGVIKCPQKSNVTLTYEGVDMNKNIAQEYLPELNKGKVKEWEAQQGNETQE